MWGSLGAPWRTTTGSTPPGSSVLAGTQVQVKTRWGIADPSTGQPFRARFGNQGLAGGGETVESVNGVRQGATCMARAEVEVEALPGYMV
jgi:hypothetical protein